MPYYYSNWVDYIPPLTVSTHSQRMHAWLFWASSSSTVQRRRCNLRAHRGLSLSQQRTSYTNQRNIGNFNFAYCMHGSLNYCQIFILLSPPSSVRHVIQVIEGAWNSFYVSHVPCLYVENEMSLICNCMNSRNSKSPRRWRLNNQVMNLDRAWAALFLGLGIWQGSYGPFFFHVCFPLKSL